jgi:nicotinamidase-related amidase
MYGRTVPTIAVTAVVGTGEWEHRRLIMVWTPPPSEITVTIRLPEPKAFTLDAAKTGLVIVDMQNLFCKPGWQGSDWPGKSVQRANDVIEPNVRLLAKARAAGAKVIFIQSVRSPDAIEFTVFHRPLHLIEGSGQERIVDELTPLPDEIVVQKRSHDPFNHTRLDDVLVAEGFKPGDWTVLVTGVSAAGCAKHAALGFSVRDYQTLIPMDCTAASLEDEAMTFLSYMRPGYSYDMDFTLSDLVTFVPARRPLEAATVSPGA